MSNNKDIKPTYNGLAHGYWETYWNNYELWYKRFYHKGKTSGYCEWYHRGSNMNITNKVFYIT